MWLGWWLVSGDWWVVTPLQRNCLRWNWDTTSLSASGCHLSLGYGGKHIHDELLPQKLLDIELRQYFSSHLFSSLSHSYESVHNTSIGHNNPKLKQNKQNFQIFYRKFQESDSSGLRSPRVIWRRSQGRGRGFPQSLPPAENKVNE